MLKLELSQREIWNDDAEEFITLDKPITLCLEHSLVSLSKWESKYKKPYLSSEKTNEEILDYIKMMTITQNIDLSVYNAFTDEEFKKINEYILDTHTATWFNDNTKASSNGSSYKPHNREQITSELIYYWMISYNIPLNPCEKWHLNRLLTLIRIFSIKNAEQSGKSNRMSRRDILSQNKALNAARRKQMNSKG